MKNIPLITTEDCEHQLSWRGVMEALADGHKAERAQIDDILFQQDGKSLLNRAAWINGKGMGVKTATIFPNNQNLAKPLPNVNAVFSLFEDCTGLPTAIIDGTFLTKWKTAGDSILGSHFLARQDSRTLVILGAGAVAESLVEAYSEAFPNLEQIVLWNRTFAKAQDIAARYSTPSRPVIATQNLEQAIRSADIVSSATMSIEPFINGDWVQPGTHIDLIGAFRPDMREAMDNLITKARLFVDARETTLHDIGEIRIPLEQGTISEADIIADFYDLCAGTPGRQNDQEITLFKNGGGAHLDVMTALYIYNRHRSAV
ncbi:ornithine cyclodeaminase family protein [Parendozoicomonas haliclonae]|uniref:L-lysine cyclodeaminase n=1 Tax=Parendozoicomonas haliclonae TaxID=1960125 RepID=A0A1X7AKT6_9GAMM|nr:NAD(P)-binding domain-containing protein [Parendozoicomonas haliclonae]SMA44367.1 L-lysine cyclodeaminase [Parendozoicomonas haliclonae]